MKRRKEFIIVLISLLVIVLSVSVAYFTIRILGTGKEISVDFADLKVIFTSGNGTINGTNIEPGWSSGENTFTVKNESNGTYKYNIIIKDLVNTFVTNGFLVYKITSTDGGYNMTDFVDVPKSSAATDTVLAENISINKGATHTYKIEIKYLESSTVNQDEDQGKTLSGKIFIEKYEIKLFAKLIEDNSTIGTRNDFSVAFTTNTPNTLYRATENGTDVYYFAGQDTESTPINNWIKFGKYQTDLIKYKGFPDATTDTVYKGYNTMEECTSATSYNVNCTAYKYASAGDDMYWKIIRSNSDGSIRLLYFGVSPDTTEGYIGFSPFSINIDSPKYAGYMYGDDDSTLDGIRANTNDSTIKKYIDNWYENNLTTYTNYLSNDAVYCNDREVEDGITYSTSSNLYFKSRERLYTSKTPTYDCINNKDAFSVNNTEAKLKYPIALMTADEVAYAGGVSNKEAPMWYYTNSTYNSITGLSSWRLLSPYGWSTSEAHTWGIGGSRYPGYLSLNTFIGSYRVRPVTSLKSCVQWKSGDGSATNPYEIVENGGC